MSSFLVVHLTVENVQAVFEKTSDREKLCCYWLEIPDDKCGDAATAANYFVNHVTGYKKWRWIIWFLDCIGDSALADSLMDHAEHHAGECMDHASACSNTAFIVYTDDLLDVCRQC